MHIVIDIPENTYKATCSGSMLPPDVKNVVNAIKSGTVLPKGHGALIDRDELAPKIHGVKSFVAVIDAPTIIEADK